MTAFVDEHRGARGVEPICRALRIAPSAYYARLARRADPARASARSRRDAELRAEIRRVRAANSGVHGAREVWRQLGREGIAVARCAVERLMRDMGLRGVVRGRGTRTTVSNPAAPCPADRANRRFRAPAPNVLWPSGFTYAAAWQGFVHVAFAIDAFARRIVGWRVSRTAHAGFVLDAPEQALHDRRPDDAAILHPPFGELRARGLTDDAWRRLGLPPTSTLDGLYVVLAATKAPRAACVVPNSFLFRTTRAEQLLKERVIRQDGLDTVVGLPREALGRHSGVQASMLLFRMNSELARGWQVLMVDAKHAAEADADGWHEPVARALRARDDSEISCTVSLEEIAQQDFNITVERYVLDSEARRAQDILSEAIPLDELAGLYRPQALSTGRGRDLPGPDTAGLELLPRLLEVGVSDIDEAGIVRPPRKVVPPTPEVVQRSRKSRLEPGDILLVIKGSVGKIGYVREIPEGETWLASQSFVIVRLNRRGPISDPLVLFRFLSSEIGQAAIRKLTVGTVIPGLQMTDVRRVPVLVPPLAIQGAIADELRELLSTQDRILALRGEFLERIRTIWPDDPSGAHDGAEGGHDGE